MKKQVSKASTRSQKKSLDTSLDDTTELSSKIVEDSESGNKSQSKSLTKEKSQDQKPKVIGDCTKLITCTNCHKSWNYSKKAVKTCLTCKSAYHVNYKCGKCEKVYSLAASLYHHCRYDCGQEKSLCCDHCNYKTNYKPHLSEHIQARHLPRDPTANKCQKCRKSFSTPSNLLAHSKNCGKSRREKRSLMQHLACEHCDYKTSYKPNLSRHIQLKHLTRDPNLNHCEKCKKSLSTRSSLLKHSKICGKSKSEIRSLMHLSCDHCNYKTNFKPHLSEHIQARHLPRDPTANKCQKCRKSFSTPSNLLAHSKICGKSKSYKRSISRFSCAHCSYTSDSKANLASHIQKKHLPQDQRFGVTGRKFFNCAHCKYKNVQKSILARHIQVKHIVREADFYECQDCGQNFDSQDGLLEHTKICLENAEVERRRELISCAHCNFKSYTEADLKQHMQSEHTHKCRKCGKCYSSDNLLKKHLKRNRVCSGEPEKPKSRAIYYGDYVCDLCKFRCYDPLVLLKHHIKKHSNRTFGDLINGR